MFFHTFFHINENCFYNVKLYLNSQSETLKIVKIRNIMHFSTYYSPLTNNKLPNTWYENNT